MCAHPRWYLGTVLSYNEATKKHTIDFEGTEREIDVHSERFQFKFVRQTATLLTSYSPPSAADELPPRVTVPGVAPDGGAALALEEETGATGEEPEDPAMDPYDEYEADVAYGGTSMQPQHYGDSDDSEEDD